MVGRRTRIALAAAVWGVPSMAVAAPNDGYAMSDDAALMGGAVLASGRDVASGWYNPALLTSTRRLRADVSASAYGIRWVRVPRSMQLQGPTEQRNERMRSREFLVVPTAFSLGSEVSDRVSIGFGFFTSRFSEPLMIARTGGRYADAFSAEIRRSDVQRRYHTGPMVGFRVHEDLDLGLALYGTYDKSAISQRVFVEHEGELGRSTLLVDADTTVRSYGMQGALGLRGRLGEWVHAAASVRTPTVVVFQRVEGSDVEIESTTDRAGDTMMDTRFEGFPVQRRPTRIATWTAATGLAVGQGRWRVGLDAEATPAHYPDNPAIGKAAHWNVRLGMRWRFSPRWSMGGGLFTDRNDTSSTTFGSLRVNLWGGSLGVRLRTPVKLDDDERARRISFQTTVAVRYAAGRGEAGGFAAIYSDEGISPQRVEDDRTVGASMHLLTVHVGSGLVF